MPVSVDWSKEEVGATAADYFMMLAAELSNIPYSKARHRHQLMSLLNGRSEQAIEYKHSNISAILIKLGFPYISGYKPRSNYQRLLFEIVSDHLLANQKLIALAEADLARAIKVPNVDNILKLLTDAPRPFLKPLSVAEPKQSYSVLPVNYLEREAKNRILGLAGEEFVINFECARLMALKKEDLAARIEHVSKTQGDSAGFDILSYETTGAERLIEVKTTKYGKETPFFISRNELDVSVGHAERYYLYRVFDFRHEEPHLFNLQGSLSSTCILDPASYIACVA